MGLSIKQLNQVIEEFNIELVGGMIRRIDQPHPKMILFEIEKNRQRLRLLFSAHPQFSRCHLIQKKYPNPKMPPHFCQLLRSHLRYKRIQSIKALEGDRIIQITAAWSGDDLKPLTFSAELTGLASNFFLIDSKECILGTLTRPPVSRSLSIGDPYHLPEIRPAHVFKEPQIPLAGPSPFRLNLSLEIYFSELEKEEEANTVKKDLLAQFSESIRRQERRLKRFTAQVREAEESLKYQEYGEYLKCHLQAIEAGADHFIYFKVEQTGSDPQRTVVRLDPALSAVENMGHFFKKYKKSVSGKPLLLKLMEETKNTLLQLETGQKVVMEGKSIQLDDYPLHPRQKIKTRKSAQKSPATYLSSDDMRLLVGRNDRENEEITFHIARGNDLWFHARGVPGAHVLVKMAQRKDIPPQTLLEAATLALYFSRYKKEGKGEAMYTFKKYIQRPKKGRVGSVICSQEKTLYLEIEKNRLSKILQGRLLKVSSEGF